MSRYTRANQLEKSYERSMTTKTPATPVVAPIEEEALIIPLDDDLELEPLSEEEEPKVYQNPPSFVELKYPFDIKNLHVREVMVHDNFGCSKQQVYDVSCFSSAQYVTKSIGFTVSKLYPGYQYRIYSYRAVKRMKGTEVKRMKFIYKIDHKKEFVHVNVELH